jgi:hypothetical protein
MAVSIALEMRPFAVQDGSSRPAGVTRVAFGDQDFRVAFEQAAHSLCLDPRHDLRRLAGRVIMDDHPFIIAEDDRIVRGGE